MVQITIWARRDNRLPPLNQLEEQKEINTLMLHKITTDGALDHLTGGKGQTSGVRPCNVLLSPPQPPPLSGHGAGGDAPLPREGVLHPGQAKEEEGPGEPARGRGGAAGAGERAQPERQRGAQGGRGCCRRQGINIIHKINICVCIYNNCSNIPTLTGTDSPIGSSVSLVHTTGLIVPQVLKHTQRKTFQSFFLVACL